MKRMYSSLPERGFEPPEDKRRKFATCPICEDDIMEGDECYDIPNYGYCCARCIKDAHVWEAEVDD